MKAPFLIGRLLFAGFFLNSGISHIQKRKEMAAYARAKGVPETGGNAICPTSISRRRQHVARSEAQVGCPGGTRFPGWSLSREMHDFWRNEDPDERQTNMIMFMKNVALAGGALGLMGVDEPWEASVPVRKATVSDKLRKAGRRIAA